MADDHAAKAISAYGEGINKTPNIDRIANEGVRLNHCYVTNSICTPSRAAILTGTYNHVNCVTTLNTPIDNRLPNVAKHLQYGGYQTAIIGKWHLGKAKSMNLLVLTIGQCCQDKAAILTLNSLKWEGK